MLQCALRLGLFTTYISSSLAGLWLCSVSYLPRLQLGVLKVPLWMKWARSVSSFWWESSRILLE